MSWLFSQALVEEYLVENFSDGEQSVPLSGNPIQLAYCAPDKMTDFSRLSRFGMTYKPLTESRGEELLTLYRAGFHVKTSQQPEKVQELTENDQECGSTWRGWLAKYDPDTSLWRTAQCSLLEDLNESLATLPRSGMTRSGLLWELPMLEQTTKGTESGLSENWPTPRSCSAMAATITPESAWNKKRNPNLETIIGQRMWPTPAARDGKPTNTLETLMEGRFVDQLANRVKMVESNLWTTPTSRDWKGTTISKNHPKGFNKSLANDVLKMPKKWPTPTMQGLNGGSNSRLAAENKGTDLKILTGGKLNPTWVEWLMGWPLGWTDLKPLETDKFHCVQQQHGDC
jgi:hypothetical protein